MKKEHFGQFEQLPDFEKHLQTALYRTYEVHEVLGSKGEELIQKNQFGDTTLRIDIEAEEAVLESLRKDNLPIRVISEEHGTVDLDSNPQFLGVLDGLDGSNRYEAGRGKERYGTMFGIFSKLNPTYGDYLTSGVMEHSTGKLFVSEKGKGSFVVMGGEKQLIRASAREQLEGGVRIYLNEHWEICRSIFGEKLGMLKFTDPRAYSTYFSDLASGNVDLVLTCTAENNLELAIGFGLIKEAGGVMVDINGNDLQNYDYLQFGQDEQIPIITAATEELAQELIQHL